MGSEWIDRIHVAIVNGDVRALADRVLVLEAGAVVQRGTADALAAAPATDFVADFFEPLRHGVAG